MSVREVNQRWLATMGLDDQTIALRDEIKQRAARLRATYGARPPWWRPFARRRLDRWMSGVEERVIRAMQRERELEDAP